MIRQLNQFSFIEWQKPNNRTAWSMFGACTVTGTICLLIYSPYVPSFLLTFFFFFSFHSLHGVIDIDICRYSYINDIISYSSMPIQNVFVYMNIIAVVYKGIFCLFYILLYSSRHTHPFELLLMKIKSIRLIVFFFSLSLSRSTELLLLLQWKAQVHSMDYIVCTFDVSVIFYQIQLFQHSILIL